MSVLGGALTAGMDASAASNAGSLIGQGVGQATGLFNQNSPAVSQFVQPGASTFNNLTSSLNGNSNALGNLFNTSSASSNPFNVNTILQGYQGSPGFNFQVGQANAATQNSAAAAGGLLSGNTTSALNNQATQLADANAMQYAQTQQSGESSYFSNLLGTANTMLGASNTGLGAAENVLNNSTSLGNAIIGGYGTAANAETSALTQGASAAGNGISSLFKL